MTGNSSDLLLIGIGNTMRQDDAIGIEVVRNYKSQFPNSLSVIEIKDDLTRLLNIWDNKDVIVIDAVESGNEGLIEIYDFKELIRFSQALRNSHSIGFEQVLRLAIELHQGPRSIYFIGIPSQYYGLGDQIRMSIKEKIPEIISKILKYQSRNI